MYTLFSQLTNITKCDKIILGLNRMDNRFYEDLIYYIEVKCVELNGPTEKIAELAETARIVLKDGKDEILKEILEEMLDLLTKLFREL